MYSLLLAALYFLNLFRNNLRTEDTFLAVQMLGSDGVSWVDVATDGNWETKFEWNRPSPGPHPPLTRMPRMFGTPASEMRFLSAQ